MIVFNGDEYLSESEKLEVQEFTETSILRSYQAIDYFFESIGLDSNLFSHLKSIPIIIENNNDYKKLNIAAFFKVRDEKSNEPAIHILASFINKLIKVGKIDNSINSSINQLAWSIIHETIHFNRCIMINDIVSINDTNIIIHGNSNKFKKTYNELEYLLSLYYNSNKGNSIYNILKVTIEDIYLDIFTYNEKDKTYELYLINKDDIGKISSLDDLNGILTLNYLNNKNNYEPYAIIKRMDKYNEEDMCMNFDLHNTTDVPFDFVSGFITRNKISLNEGFEESITEAFAGIITIMNSHRNLNIYEACDELYNIINCYDIKLAIDLIKKMSIDDIRWFFLSCYEDEYHNRFEDIIPNDYDKLLECFNELYIATNNKKEVNEEIYYEGRRIINNDINKKITVI